MERIDAVRAPHTIISTNTSGIPVASIAEGRSTEFKQNFLGTHFFNPPRYLKLVEVIPTQDTLPEVVDFISHFLEFRLGKGVVPAKDTPNFIANRLGFGSGAFALDHILKNGYTVEEVDNITGPTIGRHRDRWRADSSGDSEESMWSANGQFFGMNCPVHINQSKEST